MLFGNGAGSKNAHFRLAKPAGPTRPLDALAGMVGVSRHRAATSRCEVRQFDQEVGVIMVTGVNEEEAGRQALKAGAFDYIVKPLDLEYLERSLWYKITTMLL